MKTIRTDSAWAESHGIQDGFYMVQGVLTEDAGLIPKGSKVYLITQPGWHRWTTVREEACNHLGAWLCRENAQAALEQARRFDPEIARPEVVKIELV